MLHICIGTGLEIAILMPAAPSTIAPPTRQRARASAWKKNLANRQWCGRTVPVVKFQVRNKIPSMLVASPRCQTILLHVHDTKGSSLLYQREPETSEHVCGALHTYWYTSKSHQPKWRDARDNSTFYAHCRRAGSRIQVALSIIPLTLSRQLVH